MILLTLIGLGLVVGLVAMDDDDTSNSVDDTTNSWDDAENRDVVLGDSGDNSLFGNEGQDLMGGATATTSCLVAPMVM